jgi:signal transduction histidine kinase
VRRPRLSARLRLTLLCTGLFAVGGAIVVVLTYGLVASSLQSSISAGDRKSLTGEDVRIIDCKRVLTGQEPADADVRNKCKKAFDAGVLVGAQVQRDAVLSNLLWQSLATLAAVTLLAAASGWFVAGRVLRPVHRITEAAREASEHNLSARVALTGPRDELRELADTFDAMLARLDAAFDGQRRFIANASHELRTPLTVVRTTVDVVLAKPEPSRGELLRMGRAVRAAAAQAEALIEALLTLARVEPGLAVREPADLATIAEDVLDATDLRDVRAEVSLAPALVAGDPILLERLTANLLDNAVRYNVPGGAVRLTTSTVDGHSVLEVTNSGPTVPADAVDGLFEPFSRLRERTAADGFGLGLAIVASITQAHEGAIEAAANDGGGLRIAVRLPRPRAAEFAFRGAR